MSESYVGASASLTELGPPEIIIALKSNQYFINQIIHLLVLFYYHRQPNFGTVVHHFTLYDIIYFNIIMLFYSMKVINNIQYMNKLVIYSLSNNIKMSR